MERVADHYNKRLEASERLKKLYDESSADAFARSALGISEPDCNYSANEHKLGPRILSLVKPVDVLNLAQQLMHCDSPQTMIEAIYKRNIRYLKVSVGSEIAMMLNPEKYWVANTRSAWAHLLIKYNFNYKTANEALRLYRDQDDDSEMAYRKWKAIYFDMRPDMIELGNRGDQQAKAKGLEIGSARNIWIDAIANALYENR
jgi:hypothetical protein